MDETALKKEYEKFGLRYYTPKEELWNAITHGIGSPITLAFMVYLLIIASSAVEVASAILLCIPALAVYTTSCVYHALQNFKAKSLARRIDHANIAFLVTACGVPHSLLFSNKLINYIGIAVCFALAILNAFLCVYDLIKFKRAGVIIDAIIGAILLVLYVININSLYATLEVNLCFLIGLILCASGLTLYPIKKKFVHTVFHLVTLFGPLLMMVGAVLVFNLA